MKKLFLILMFSTVCFGVFSQKKEDILEIMARQQANWNSGDIDKFMEDYWKSENLQFIGSKGVVKGWQVTKDRYFKSYPDRATMGQLKFDILEVDFHSKKSAWVLGKWYLTRPEKGDVGGYFTLIFKKINGKWVIVSDHTS
ncbi:YybH family protein [Lacihabitans soyangensis]|uniref:Nuclear transport factor 2 family protein n=1 Tax=Lacihabitans soyangensis TaxID=869394 RepID=A0AAE3H5F9_9BACT|nr:nuclear transport factor 2 family protein [Lacihabitans soyangensis]MCP9764341.1 nuclear transport factor 2 family protein [Lacihabitans soyangensis]